MTNTTIREIQGDEMLDVMYALTSYALDPSPPLPDKAERQEIIKGRKGVTYFALCEDDTPVACAASAAMTQQVRGVLFGMGGIWGVATHPAARRRGYSRRILARLWGAVREREQTLSCLYPFRESFYERLGYVTFPQPRRVKFAPAALAPLLKQELGGEVRQVLIGDGFEAYRDFVLKMRQRVHGMALFDHPDKAVAQRNTVWLALAEVNGELVGVMLYELKGDRPTEYNMRVSRFYYHTSLGKYLLLQWIARHIDQANRVEMSVSPFELPETWLADMEVTPELIFRAPMGRVLDVAKIGGMETGPGRFAARVSDPLCPWNEGVWEFETIDGQLKVRVGKEPSCELSIHALAALIYGTHDPDGFSIRGWGNPSPGVQEIMRRMFPPLLPYLHEYF